MWRLSEAELNWVSTKMRFRPACRQLLIGMSISRYLPPSGTAGFERMWVSGNSRVPRPPPRISVRTSFIAPSYLPDAPVAAPRRGRRWYAPQIAQLAMGIWTLARCAELFTRVFTQLSASGEVQLRSRSHFVRGWQLMQMFEKKLTHNGHTTRFSVSEGR